MTDYIWSSAHISEDQKYRYWLLRKWSRGSRMVNFIGLNPSTADEEKDDATIRRCVGFAKEWGFNKLMMTNIFAYRATDPDELWDMENPVGEENNYTLIKVAKKAELVVAAWGYHGSLLKRSEFVRLLLQKTKTLHALKLTARGEPAHPLYLKKTLKPFEWTA